MGKKLFQNVEVEIDDAERDLVLWFKKDQFNEAVEWLVSHRGRLLRQVWIGVYNGERHVPDPDELGTASLRLIDIGELLLRSSRETTEEIKKLLVEFEKE